MTELKSRNVPAFLLFHLIFIGHFGPFWNNLGKHVLLKFGLNDENFSQPVESVVIRISPRKISVFFILYLIYCPWLAILGCFWPIFTMKIWPSWSYEILITPKEYGKFIMVYLRKISVFVLFYISELPLLAIFGHFWPFWPICTMNIWPSWSYEILTTQKSLIEV